MLFMSKAVLVVDCGSGHTGAKTYSMNPSGMVIEKDYSSVKMPTIVEAMQEGPSSVANWVKQLATATQDSACERILVAATAGLRAAIQDGELSSSVVESFREALTSCKSFKVPVEFKLLTGLEETQFEHVAVTYVSSIMLPPECQPVGLMSGGGMSSQVAYYADSSAAFATPLELRTNWFLGLETLLQKGIDDGLQDINQRLEQVISDTSLVGCLRGTFFGIESFARYCVEAGIGGRLVTKANAVDSVQKALDEWTLHTKQTVDVDAERAAFNAGRQDGARIAFHHGVMYTQVLQQLSLLHESALLYCTKLVEIAPSITVMPEWSLGFFLSCIGHSSVSKVVDPVQTARERFDKITSRESRWRESGSESESAPK